VANVTVKLITSGTVAGSTFFNGLAFSSAGEAYITNTTNPNLSRVNNDYSLTIEGSVTGGAVGDMTSCAFPANPLSALEFADAPDSYGTLQASNGARHALSFYDADTHTAKLMLGSLIDPELNGVPATARAAATGDDLAGIDDEDAITTFPVLNTGVSSYTSH
jgi:hypothetical protein